MPDTPVEPSGGGRYPADMESRVAVLGTDRSDHHGRPWSGIERRFDTIDRRLNRLIDGSMTDLRASCRFPLAAGRHAGRLRRHAGRLRRHAGRHGARVPLAVGNRPPSLRRPKAASRLAVMDWDAPAIVLDARPYGEGDAIATVMTEEHGAHRGLARGGAARGRTAIWQPGNLVQVRWVARLADQLGSFSAELVHPGGRSRHGRSARARDAVRGVRRGRRAPCRNVSRIRACSTACCT